MSRNKREGKYAGWCYGVHRRTKEQLYTFPAWFWYSRKVKSQSTQQGMRYTMSVYDFLKIYK